MCLNILLDNRVAGLRPDQQWFPVHQHQARHKRQDPSPYLPVSYIIPGGEGSGPWGEWGEVSSCSRTCGGGVASQKRICLEPESQKSCTGGDTKYFSCQTQDCPAGSGDFRAEQCAEFDDKEFHGNKYKTQNPCELACKPRDERFYFRHKPQVVDGTRCNDDSFDVCVNGVCKHVGCDMMLGSSAREDKCRVCRGNGTNCFTMEGFINSQDLFQGYNNLLFIPEGSMNIIIEEVEPSSNYLALRDKNGSYYLNGGYNMNFPGKIIVPGGFCSYNRIEQDFLSLDTLHCLGPTTKPLYLYLLLQDENVGIKYEFSFAVENNNPSEKQYNWVYEEYTPCSATCGGGFQTRNVTCRFREELEVVDNNLCDEGLKPPTNQSCNQDPCPAQWVAGPWGDCSKRCGSGGVRSREVTCQKVIANGIASIVPEKECFELLGPKPELFQKCNEDAACPDWFVGHWKPCDKLCDEGKQTRQVVCRQKINGRVTVLADGNCTDEKPAVEQKCMIQPCDGVDWVTSDWSECDTCTSNSRTRKVLCLTKHHIRINDSFCSHHRRPVEQEECVGNLAQSKAQWHATEWSKCSVASGDRVQTRKVFCGVYKNESLEQVEDSNCTHLLKCNVAKSCSESEEEYPSQWFTGPWSLCSEYCGGGEQYRRVTCMRGWKEDFNCPLSNVPDSTQLCNTQPCLPEIIEIQDSSSPGEKKLQCKDSKFGCCPDNKTAAVGPFDEGCRIPRECSYSIFGCCPDGVSPKLNETDEGCPVEPCADTLFGCCLSDNKTAAQGNDQDNCPPLSPSCLSSLFGSCTNNEPEVTGVKKMDYLENITTTTEGSGTLETSEGSTNGTVTTEVDSTTLDSSNYNRTEAKRPKDPVRTPARIVGGENVLVIGELGSPLSVLCLTYGNPQPYVLWYKGYDISNALYNDDVYEARDNVLLIRSLAMDTLGQYTCQAYNGQGKAAIWTRRRSTVTVAPAARHRTVAARIIRLPPMGPTTKDAACCKPLDAAQITASLPKDHILKDVGVNTRFTDAALTTLPSLREPTTRAVAASIRSTAAVRTDIRLPLALTTKAVAAARSNSVAALTASPSPRDLNSKAATASTPCTAAAETARPRRLALTLQAATAPPVNTAAALMELLWQLVLSSLGALMYLRINKLPAACRQTQARVITLRRCGTST
ncbi:unnamed protein product [Spodoptera exigua]|nr:unnamed protein product [Spodoptera exigua]